MSHNLRPFGKRYKILTALCGARLLNRDIAEIIDDHSGAAARWMSELQSFGLVANVGHRGRGGKALYEITSEGKVALALANARRGPQ